MLLGYPLNSLEVLKTKINTVRGQKSTQPKTPGVGICTCHFFDCNGI